MRLLLFVALLVATATHAADFRDFMAAYCLDCHDSDSKKGDLDLSRFTSENAVMKDRAIWRSVYAKVESHQMPPPKQKTQPKEGERQQLMAWIMDIAARPDPVLGACDPGKPVLRRLTRLEYNNTIRDLFGARLDMFIFSERLPVDKKYFDPAAQDMGQRLVVPVREYGLKYPVLLPDAGMPGDNRAEHGFTNRGEVMNVSPLLLERYLEVARAITHSPKLPDMSPTFRALVSDPATPQRASAVEVPVAADAAEFDAAPDFAPNFNVPDEAKDGDLMMTTYQHRFGVRSGVAEGIAGVWDAPARSRVINAGTDIRVKFGLSKEKAMVITPHEDIWIAGFSTATETSGESLFTNQVKDAKQLALDLRVEGGAEGEAVVEAGICALSRKGESGTIVITATFSNGATAKLQRAMSKGEGIGNTFFGFRAPAGAAITSLQLDGSAFSGNYALFDDLGFITGRMEMQKTQRRPITKLSSREQREVVRRRLTDFMARAFRRPLSSGEIEPYVEVFSDSLKKLGFEDAMREALAAVLTAPDFLFITESAVENVPARHLNGHELATRLSYFLWSSLPDETLFAAADAGALHSDAQLKAQTLRMLKDTRVRELSECFAAQWLRLDQLYTAKPDPKLFKSFYSGPQGKTTLHGAMLVEALLLFETTLIEDRSVLDFINADYTWLNPELARHYKFESLLPAEALKKRPGDDSTLVTAKTNSMWYRAKLPKGSRGGFITMAAPLTLTSLPVRTSPVKRGAWLLETIFNRPPQEPKIAFVLKEGDSPVEQAASVRQRFEAHRTQAECYSCHIRLDPPGFALERFSPVGQWRETDSKQAVDARASWNGQDFNGPAEFKTILARHPHEFVRGFIEHMLSYALGRDLEIHDMPVVAQIEKAAEADGYKFSRIITEIVSSYPFRHVR